MNERRPMECSRRAGAWCRGAACAVLLAGASLLALSPAHAQKPGRDLDLIWTRPGLDSLGIARVAMLPPASYTGDLKAEQTLEGLLARALRTSGHRWTSATSSRALLRAGGAGDSVFAAVRKDILQDVRVDSVAAPGVCERLRVDAVLSLRIDLWEQALLEPIQSGKPSTTVQVKAALVDAGGRLLWTASGSETGEGPYQSPQTNPYQTPGGGITTHSTTTPVGPPTFQDVVTRMVERWAARFPRAARADADAAR